MRAPLLVISAALLVACGATVTGIPGDAGPVDVAPDLDASPIDASPIDASPIDASPIDATDATPDAPRPLDRPAPVCPGRAVVDLDLVAASADGVVNYTGTVPATGARLAMWGCDGDFQPAVFRATVRTAGRLRVTSGGAATAVAVFDGCPDLNPPALSCRTRSVPAPFGLAPSVSPARSFAIGDVVYVVVGAPAAGATFQLSLGPSAPAHRGEPCDLSDDDPCEAGTVCGYASSIGRLECQLLGAAGNPCRAGDPMLACDPGLRCDAAFHTCRPLLPRDALCDTRGGSCPWGQSCAVGLEAGASVLRCRDEGAPGGWCRAALPRCDAGSVCNGAFCQRPALAVGEACGAQRRDVYCGESASCQGAVGAGVCVADGALGGRCRRVGTPCDEGASCARTETPGAVAICRRPVAPAEACDPAGLRNACPGDELCVRDGSVPRCAAAGTEGAVCRDGASPCEAGLGCAVQPDEARIRRCRPSRGRGEACDVVQFRDACAAGTTCIALDGSPAVCVADGTRGGACQAADASCEPGSGCDVRLRCRAGVAEGAACDLWGLGDVCGAPFACVTSPANPGGVCARTGYVEERAPDEDFVDACDGGARILVGDGGPAELTSARVELPFAFRAYGADVREVRVHTNGAVSLGEEPHRLPITGAFANFPWRGASVPLVAALWDYLYPRADGASGVCVRTVGAAPDRRTVIGWRDVMVASEDDTHLTFAVVLHEGSGVVDLRYETLRPNFRGASYVNGSRGAVGMHDRAGSDATWHRAWLSAPSAIRFRPR